MLELYSAKEWKFRASLSSSHSLCGYTLPIYELEDLSCGSDLVLETLREVCKKTVCLAMPRTAGTDLPFQDHFLGTGRVSMHIAHVEKRPLHQRVCDMSALVCLYGLAMRNY